MYAYQLSAFLENETARINFSFRAANDIGKRFEQLRGSHLIPIGREKNSTILSSVQIVAGILSVATPMPGFSAAVAISMLRLVPIGGVSASFSSAATFGQALVSLIDNVELIQSVVTVDVTDSEVGINGHCRGAISFRVGPEIKTAYYVGSTAISLSQSGAERSYDPLALHSSAISSTTFTSKFFLKLAAKRRALERQMPRVPSSDEISEEEQKEARAAKLNLTPNSRFLNVSVDTQATWPKDETVVEFGGKKLILLPRTRESTTSVHIDLVGQSISTDEALTLIGRFLSILTWCDDQYSVLQDSWSGNPVPVRTPKRNLAFNTTHHWLFDRKMPDSPEVLKALSIYRDACNAHHNYLISYAVLSYYKIIELRYRGRSEARTWFKTNYELLRRRALQHELFSLLDEGRRA